MEYMATNFTIIAMASLHGNTVSFPITIPLVAIYTLGRYVGMDGHHRNVYSELVLMPLNQSGFLLDWCII